MKMSYSGSPALLATIVATLLTGLFQSSLGDSATWLANPPSGDWNNPLNWTAGGPPNGSFDTATFATSSETDISLSANIEANGITFGAGASAYTITISPTFGFAITGVGITNSAAPQNFVTDVDGAGNLGIIQFTGSATAGSATTFTNNGSSLGTFSTGGITQFFSNATAGSATFINKPGEAANATGGRIQFFDSSNAGNGIFAINAVTIEGAISGAIYFSGNSSADHGSFVCNGGTAGGAQSLISTFSDNATAANATFTINGPTVANAAGGALWFVGNSTAANATFTNNGVTFNAEGNFASGFTNFRGNSTAGNATLTSNGGVGSGALGGATFFSQNATAGNATLIANGGSGGGAGGFTRFNGDSTGGTARVEVFGNGYLDISFHNPPGITIGSLEGDGDVFLGSNRLTVGNNPLSTTLSGVLQDGGDGGGTGGSIVKSGVGTLSLSNANTYTGGTRVSAGALQALHDGAVGGGDVTMLVAATTLTLQNGTNNDYIADTATLNIVSSATINLNFTGTDTIGTLIVDGVAQPPALHGSGGISEARRAHRTGWTFGFAGTGRILADLPVAVSRKVHGATPFDIYLPLTGAPGIECRSSGGGGVYQIVVSFLNNATFNSASVTSGSGMVTSTSGNGTMTATINLSGVTNAQTINVTLFSLNDGLGTRDLVIPMAVLVGDTSGNRVVNSSDVSQTKDQSGHALTTANFREDVNVSGNIGSSDVSAVKSQVGTGLPVAEGRPQDAHQPAASRELQLR